MKRFNLSEWAITHQPLVLFMILAARRRPALYSYLNLGRAEDPSFTIKTMVVNVGWPGATAAEMQTQVADKIEKKLQELPYLDRVESYSQPGVTFIRVKLRDTTPPAKVKDLWYQVRKKVGDIRGELPPGIIGPNFNDEFGDVYSALYMLTADGLSLADLKDARRGHPPAPAAGSRRQQGRHHRRAAGEDLHRVQPRQARHARRHPAADLRQRRPAERRRLRRLGRHLGRPHRSAGDRRLLRRRRDRRRAGRRPTAGSSGSATSPTVKRGYEDPPQLPRARGRQAGARPRRLDAGRRQHHHARREPRSGDGRRSSPSCRSASRSRRSPTSRTSSTSRSRSSSRPSSRRWSSCWW